MKERFVDLNEKDDEREFDTNLRPKWLKEMLGQERIKKQLFIAIEGYSSLPQFYQFLIELENHKPLIRVTNANIVPTGNNKGLAKLNFNFTLTMLNGAPQ